ncbi:IPT/TIG domain-containing protein, partial [Nostocoides japonicum]|uniref:IPT/TIG domain-containing protein n=1 Tax=Nostocoides japonicum TaxID=99481 RepID=UPI00065B49A7
VTITGTNLTGATAVKFGTTPATKLKVVSAKKATATSPAGTAGTVDVTVTTPGGTSPTNTADRFTYTGTTPTITKISPKTGPATGGTTSPSPAPT